MSALWPSTFFFFKYKGRAILVGAGEGESLHLAHWSGHGYISPGSRAFLYTAPRGTALETVASTSASQLWPLQRSLGFLNPEEEEGRKKEEG